MSQPQAGQGERQAVKCWGPDCERTREVELAPYTAYRWYCEDCAARLSKPDICPLCNRPVAFSGDIPPKTPTCNPLRSPDCWARDE